MSQRRFEIVKSFHNMHSIEAHDLTESECNLIRLVVCNNWMDSDDYKLKEGVWPFLQGYQAPSGYGNGKDGWILVEFWSDNLVAINRWLDHLHKRLANDLEG